MLTNSAVTAIWKTILYKTPTRAASEAKAAASAVWARKKPAIKRAGNVKELVHFFAKKVIAVLVSGANET